MYTAVRIGSNWHVMNNETHITHSSWKRWASAHNTARDLNGMETRRRRQLAKQLVKEVTREVR